MNDFMRMLAAAHGNDDEEGRIKADPAAVIMDLREAAALYAASREACPFKIGDVVTTRENFNKKWAGEPGIVVDVRDDQDPIFTAGSVGGVDWGNKPDIRVMQIAQGQRIAIWSESHAFELYADAVKRKADETSAQAASIATPAADSDFQEVAA